MNTLSVITICQDEETTIRWLLECCLILKEKLNENLKEIVIVDGGSKDKTLSVIKEFESSLPLILIQHPFDSWGKQRNRALERCTGDFIFSPDADMTWTNNLGLYIKEGRFDSNSYWNLLVRFTSFDRFHFSTVDGEGGSLRLWKRGPKYVTDFHEKLENQPSSPSVMSNVYLFENCLLLNDEQLLNRGKRLQPYASILEASGGGPGGERRYIEAKERALKSYLRLPDNIIELL